MPTAAGVGACRNCGHDVSITARRCRSCGYDADPTRNERARFLSGVLGIALTLSVVGAPIGALLLWKAYNHHCAATGRVVDTREPSPPFLLWLLAPPRGLLASTLESQQNSRNP